MPSPIAHGSLVVPACAALGAETRGLRGLMAFGLVLFATVAPDMDIPISWARTGKPFLEHGSYSHSLLLAPIFGVLFACAMKLISPNVRAVRAFAVGALLYALHVVMDLLVIDSRGVSMFWPIVPGRIASPYGIFAGVEYSDWRRWDLHLLMLANEVLFGLVVWGVTAIVIRRRRRADA